MAAAASHLDEPAPEGSLYFCGACGRRSRSRSGYLPGGAPAWCDDRWTGVCAVQAALLPEAEIDVARLRAGIITMEPFCAKYASRLRVCERDDEGPRMALLSGLSPEKFAEVVAVYTDHWEKEGWVPTPER